MVFGEALPPSFGSFFLQRSCCSCTISRAPLPAVPPVSGHLHPLLLLESQQGCAQSDQRGVAVLSLVLLQNAARFILGKIKVSLFTVSLFLQLAELTANVHIIFPRYPLPIRAHAVCIYPAHIWRVRYVNCSMPQLNEPVPLQLGFRHP